MRLNFQILGDRASVRRRLDSTPRQFAEMPDAEIVRSGPQKLYSYNFVVSKTKNQSCIERPKPHISQL